MHERKDNIHRNPSIFIYIKFFWRSFSWVSNFFFRSWFHIFRMIGVDVPVVVAPFSFFFYYPFLSFLLSLILSHLFSLPSSPRILSTPHQIFLSHFYRYLFSYPSLFLSLSPAPPSSASFFILSAHQFIIIVFVSLKLPRVSFLFLVYIFFLWWFPDDWLPRANAPQETRFILFQKIFIFFY